MTTFYFILLIFINSLYHLCAMYMPGALAPEKGRGPRSGKDPRHIHGAQYYYHKKLSKG